MHCVVRQFSSDRGGSVAIMFGLALIPLAAAVGAAVDYSRAGQIHSGLQASTDSAALVACMSTATTTAALQGEAQAVIGNAFPNNSATITAFASTNNPRTVTLSSEVSYPTHFMRIVGLPEMRLGTTSACGAGEQSLEIAMVLDTTGSMSASAGSQSKLDAMKSAASSFVSTLYTSFDAAHLKMALVPFAASVRVDPAAYAPLGVPSPAATWIDLYGTSPAHWQNVTGATAAGFATRFDIFRRLSLANPAWGWQGCFEALPYPYNTQDAAPSSATPATLHVPMLAPDEVGSKVTTYFLGIPIGSSYDDGGSSSVNSYLDDGSANGGSCNKINGSNAVRMAQACKYVSAQNVEAGRSGPNWGCTSQAVQRLTTSRSSLTAQVASLTANGNTNIAEGLHWGWQALSPNGAFRDGAAYGTANLTKVVVLMTDGVNTWGHETRYTNGTSTIYTTGNSEYSAYGYFQNADGSGTGSRLPSGYATLSTSADARNAMDQLTTETCTNMKAKGVVIYAVAFSTPGDAIDASGQSLIKNCASGSDKYFLASDAASLNAAFVSIAQGIGGLRITR